MLQVDCLMFNSILNTDIHHIISTRSSPCRDDVKLKQLKLIFSLSLSLSCSQLGQSVNTEHPLQMARLHRTTAGRLLSDHIWSRHLFLGQSWGCFQLWLGSRPSDTLVWHRVSHMEVFHQTGWLCVKKMLCVTSFDDQIQHWRQACARCNYHLVNRTMPPNPKNVSLVFYVEGSTIHIPNSWCQQWAESMCRMHITRGRTIVWHMCDFVGSVCHL